MCVHACVRATHHYTHDCGWYKTEESWQPKEHCEDYCSHHAGHKGILGEFGVCRPCKYLLCGHNGHLRLGQDHL